MSFAGDVDVDVYSPERAKKEWKKATDNFLLNWTITLKINQFTFPQIIREGELWTSSLQGGRPRSKWTARWFSFWGKNVADILRDLLWNHLWAYGDTWTIIKWVLSVNCSQVPSYSVQFHGHDPPLKSQTGSFRYTAKSLLVITNSLQLWWQIWRLDILAGFKLAVLRFHGIGYGTWQSSLDTLCHIRQFCFEQITKKSMTIFRHDTITDKSTIFKISGYFTACLRTYCWQNKQEAPELRFFILIVFFSPWPPDW